MTRLHVAHSLIALSIAGGCAVPDSEEVGPPPDESKTDDGQHIQAKNCELFIDKIVAFQGSHAMRAVTFWVKTLGDHFDGDVTEVGMRTRLTGAGAESWQDRKFSRFFGASDYFQNTLTVSSDWGRTTYEAALYARTDAGTTYWFKPSGGGNFFFDINTHDNVMNAMHKSYNYDSSINAAVPTQRDDLTYFNPNHCY